MSPMYVPRLRSKWWLKIDFWMRLCVFLLQNIDKLHVCMMYFLFSLIDITVYTATEGTYFHVLNTSMLQPHCFCLPLFVNGSTHLTLLNTLC